MKWVEEAENDLIQAQQDLIQAQDKSWKELTEEDIQYLEQWLNNPIDSETTQRIIVKTMPLHLTTQASGAEYYVKELDTAYYEIAFGRRKIDFFGKWWLDIAYREDTKEPVAFVSHEGNWKWTSEEIPLQKESFDPFDVPLAKLTQVEKKLLQGGWDEYTKHEEEHNSFAAIISHEKEQLKKALNEPHPFLDYIEKHPPKKHPNA